jgi:Bacterial Ig domain
MATITVGQGNQPPTVSLTLPANNATFTAPASIPLAATASDPEARMLHVEFYAGTTLLNSDTAAPYSFTWSSVPTGTYALKAVAYDADGNSTSSIVNTVAVTAAPRSVVFVESSDHATLVTLYRLDIFPSGSDPATATRVASSDLGKPTPAANGEITVDRATFFASLPRGAYVATVSAVGSGGEGRGAPVTFTR